MNREQIDCVAKEVFSAMRYAAEMGAPQGMSPPNWVFGGNSDMQNVARQHARSIIAALPDCIPDLVWSSVNEANSPLGSRYVAFNDGSWLVYAYKASTSGRSDQRDMQGAQSACNEHHRAAIIGTFKKD